MNPHGITHTTDLRPLTPACTGKWRTFDSVDPLLSAIARDLCDTCPVLMECRQQRDAWLASSTTARASVEGTWAGRTYGEHDTREKRREAGRRTAALRAARRAAEPPPTHCPNGHPWNEETTYTNEKTGRRQCRPCRRAAAKRLRARLAAQKENAA